MYVPPRHSTRKHPYIQCDIVVVQEAQALLKYRELTRLQVLYHFQLEQEKGMSFCQGNSLQAVWPTVNTSSNKLEVYRIIAAKHDKTAHNNPTLAPDSDHIKTADAEVLSFMEPAQLQILKEVQYSL